MGAVGGGATALLCFSVAWFHVVLFNTKKYIPFLIYSTLFFDDHSGTLLVSVMHKAALVSGFPVYLSLCFQRIA